MIAAQPGRCDRCGGGSFERLTPDPEGSGCEWCATCAAAVAAERASRPAQAVTVSAHGVTVVITRSAGRDGAPVVLRRHRRLGPRWAARS